MRPAPFLTPRAKKVLKPKLIVIAGPNGSGKTTFTDQALRHDWSEGCLFINPDEIAKNDFGDWNSPEAVMKAAVRAQKLREECLRDRRSMLIETVFSAPDKLDFIRWAIEADFFIRFFFIGTDSPQINAARITKRVMDGGHDVPITKIISRYNRSIANGTVAISMVDRAYGYDNSVDDREPKKLFRAKDGLIVKTYANLMDHEWARTMAGELVASAVESPRRFALD
ncbi:MAG: zeta toxin family protein [Nitrospirae bacterium]|nr:zeta toxin family protein [Nitrospirota bacterium]